MSRSGSLWGQSQNVDLSGSGLENSWIWISLDWELIDEVAQHRLLFASKLRVKAERKLIRSERYMDSIEIMEYQPFLEELKKAAGQYCVCGSVSAGREKGANFD